MAILTLIIILLLPLSANADPVQIDDGHKLTVIADVTVTSSATLISASNANRASLNCTNTDAGVHVRWGSSSVTATTGQQLQAGLAISIRNTAAIYMISEGTDVTVSCTEEVR